ncbi:MAG: class I SAM-dependent methyltransferase [Bacteroidales bacterium]
MDLSRWMITISAEKFARSDECLFVRGDVYNLPFPNSSFDLIISRTAPYCPEELIRVLKKGGHFLKYDQGPEDYSEISKTFGKRYTIKKPSWIGNLNYWKEEENKRHKNAGFKEVDLQDYTVTQYYTLDSLIMLIKMVPLVKNFDEKKDKNYLDKIRSQYQTHRGIAISRQYFILVARK